MTALGEGGIRGVGRLELRSYQRDLQYGEGLWGRC